MEELRVKKLEIRNNISKNFNKLSSDNISKKTKSIEQRLFEFANFVEAKISLLYIGSAYEVASKNIINQSLYFNKIVVLPSYNKEKHEITLIKIDNTTTDLKLGKNDILEPDAQRCKMVPIDFVEIALIPGLAFDEKGGRVGSGDGLYDRLIPKLPSTARKVGLAYESQILQQVPMESHDKHVDIIITEDRVIYRI
ncbi:MAG: 5-formyltetrahydrofolate cyclo-ligase [Proteobacteria bacterium]|nr:5-formyltetrahydrofolate cyclo-ligase [Pseudomonadota bacterium]